MSNLEIREVYLLAEDITGDFATSYPLNCPDTEKLPEHRVPCTLWGVYAQGRSNKVWLKDFLDLEQAKNYIKEKEKI